MASQLQSLQRGKPLAVLGQQLRGTRFWEHEVRSVLNPPESTGIGCWSFNPYVGCEFGCSYCYARFAHRYLTERSREAGLIDGTTLRELRGPRGVEGFERNIFVKRRQSVLRALEHDLARIASRSGGVPARETLVIGTATDPYQPAERKFEITKAVLERLRTTFPLRLEIITKSPLIVRDIPLLLELSRRHRLSVNLSIIAASRSLIRLFEPRSPMPHARLRALGRLTRAGINAGILVAPVIPGVTDRARVLRKLLEAAKEERARYARCGALRLYPAVRSLVLPILERRFPRLAARYHEAYSGSSAAPSAYAAALELRFQRIAHEVGVPTTDPLDDSSWAGPEIQLALPLDQSGSRGDSRALAPIPNGASTER
jgi:DNA repair photolyase